jgi:hypothetical protein
MNNIKFKTEEIGVDNRTRTIVKTVIIPEKVRTEEFSLVDKEKELDELKRILVGAQADVDRVEEEIVEIKRQLDI